LAPNRVPTGEDDKVMFRDKHGDAGTARFQMRQKLFSIGDDYWIEDDRGERVFKVDGKALRMRKTLVFEDAAGTELLKIQERRFRIRDTMEIEDRDGHTVATVKKALISPFRDRWDVDVANGTSLEVKGHILDHEYEIEADGRQVAAVSKKWFRLSDTYGVEVVAGQDPLLILAVAAVLDATAPEPR
jgi:uncharacterized protein YxjI